MPLLTAILETSKIELEFIFKLQKFVDGERRQVLTLPLHLCNLNQQLPFLTLDEQSNVLRGQEIFSAQTYPFEYE